MDELLKEHQDGVLVLTLNRPERRNALSLTLYDALLDALETAAVDDGVGAVVLTGAGGAFCAGGDVQRMASTAPAALSSEQKVRNLRRRTRIVELLHGMDKPTLAMMRGAAVGAGLSIALACDLRYGDTSVKLRTGFLDVALPGDFGGHYFLPRIVGPARARELCLTSPVLNAEQALKDGLLHALHAPEALESACLQQARRWADGPRTAIAHMKRNLQAGPQATLAQTLDEECWRHVRCTETPDHREAITAFKEKRPPVFARPESLAPFSSPT